MTSTAGGLLLVLAVMLPFVGVLAGFALGGRAVKWVAAATIAAGIVNAGATAQAYSRAESGLVYLLGGWSPPLGIALRADGLTIVMMLAVAAVILGIAVYARSSFTTPAGAREARAPLVFWTLLLAIWGSLNLVFVSGDLFTLYVALELLTFSGVPLVCLDGRGETLRAALRYLLFALAGSLLYLLEEHHPEPNTMRLIDVADPARPKDLLGGESTYSLLRGAQDLALSADLCFGARGRTLSVVDIRDVLWPETRSEYPSDWPVQDVATAGDCVYVAESENGLGLIDVRVAAAPTSWGAWRPEGGVSGVHVADGFAYVATRDGLARVDARSACDPVLRESLDAFARLDVNAAARVVEEDDDIDVAFNAVMRQLISFMMEDPRTIGAALEVVFIAKSIERIGDHSKNISESVVQVVKGKDVRHATAEEIRAEVAGE